MECLPPATFWWKIRRGAEAGVDERLERGLERMQSKFYPLLHETHVYVFVLFTPIHVVTRCTYVFVRVYVYMCVLVFCSVCLCVSARRRSTIGGVCRDRL